MKADRNDAWKTKYNTITFKCLFLSSLNKLYDWAQIFASDLPLQVCDMAYVKLHSLLQTVLCLSWEEVCFLLGQLGAPLWPGGVMDSTDCEYLEAFPHLVPIVRTLLDQHADPITLQSQLPNLPITNGSTTFAQDLKAFCRTVEWQRFYQHQVCVLVDIVCFVVILLMFRELREPPLRSLV